MLIKNFKIILPSILTLILNASFAKADISVDQTITVIVNLNKKSVTVTPLEVTANEGDKFRLELMFESRENIYGSVNGISGFQLNLIERTTKKLVYNAKITKNPYPALLASAFFFPRAISIKIPIKPRPESVAAYWVDKNGLKISSTSVLAPVSMVWDVKGIKEGKKAYFSVTDAEVYFEGHPVDHLSAEIRNGRAQVNWASPRASSHEPYTFFVQLENDTDQLRRESLYTKSEPLDVKTVSGPQLRVAYYTDKNGNPIHEIPLFQQTDVNLVIEVPNGDGEIVYAFTTNCTGGQNAVLKVYCNSSFKYLEAIVQNGKAIIPSVRFATEIGHETFQAFLRNHFTQVRDSGNNLAASINSYSGLSFVKRIPISHQDQAKELLTMIYNAEIAIFIEQNKYTSDLEGIGLSYDRPSFYKVGFISEYNDPIQGLNSSRKDTDSFKKPFQYNNDYGIKKWPFNQIGPTHCNDCVISQNTFKAVAIGKTSDGGWDVWTIDQNANLVHLK